MPSLLTEVTRGKIVESRHYGHVAVTDSQGKLVAYAGDPETITYMRSAAKPIQALNVFLSGAADRYDLSTKELAILCASHYGEPFHQEVITGFLKKMGLSTKDILTGKPYSIDEAYRTKQMIEHHQLDTYNSDCSGKHCGFLSVCLTKGYPIENYNQPEHPMQQEVLQILSEVFDTPVDDIPIGVDGCGVPVHGISVRKMAMGYARFANPASLPEKYQDACRKLYSAMNQEPEMLAGTGGFCTEFTKNTDGKFCGKLGAEAVYCIGVKDRDLGIAVKIEDGNYRALYPAVISTLNQMGLLSEQENEALKRFANPPVINTLGAIVGEIRPAFTLVFT